MRRPAILCALIAAAVLSGCGSTTRHPSPAPHPGPARRPVTLVLDFTPNAVHAGIYMALQRGYDRAAGIALHVIAPSGSTDALRLLATGKANFAILDIHDLALARMHGQGVLGILAIVQHPLASVIAQPRIRDPRQLAGQTVGVTGAPSDNAVLDSIVSGAGGQPDALHRITIGSNAVSDLLAGRVAAATGFWNDEGVALARRRPGFHVFRVEKYGAPAYPELVLCASAGALKSSPALAHDTVTALVRGYDAAIADPAAAAHALESRVPGLDASLVSAELHRLLPAFQGPGGHFGVLDRSRLRAWSRWEARVGIVERRPNLATTFDRAFAPPG
jgi:NitT/TauT family transport system substrate-binding protein/putative hydroxymethylpyrimidine transport system substrate-binding protein